MQFAFPPKQNYFAPFYVLHLTLNVALFFFTLWHCFRCDSTGLSFWHQLKLLSSLSILWILLSPCFFFQDKGTFMPKASLNHTPTGCRQSEAFPLCERGHSTQGTQALGETWPLMIADHLFGWSGVLRSASLLSFCRHCHCHCHFQSHTHPFVPLTSHCLACRALSHTAWQLLFHGRGGGGGDRARNPLWIHLPGWVWAVAKAPEKERTGLGWPATYCQGCHVLLGPSVTRNATAKLLCLRQVRCFDHLRVCVI